MERDIHRSDTGVNTVEGNVAGARAGRLTKQRDEEKAAYEKRKKQIQEDAHRAASNIDSRFNASSLAFSTSVVGLMSKEEYVSRSAGLVSASRDEATLGALEAPTGAERAPRASTLLRRASVAGLPQLRQHARRGLDCGDLRQTILGNRGAEKVRQCHGA